MRNNESPTSWLTVDFRDLTEKSGLPEGWQDVSSSFGTQATFQTLTEKGVRFLRLNSPKPGKVQIRFPLKKKFARETAFRITFLGRSSTKAGVLMGLRRFDHPNVPLFQSGTPRL